MKKMNMPNGLEGFLRLWASQTVSALGTAMTEYALVIWVYGQRGTASSVTLLTLCTFLPTILFRFAGGALADRWDKKRVMLADGVFEPLMAGAPPALARVFGAGSGAGIALMFAAVSGAGIALSLWRWMIHKKASG